MSSKYAGFPYSLKRQQSWLNYMFFNLFHQIHGPKGVDSADIGMYAWAVASCVTKVLGGQKAGNALQWWMMTLVTLSLLRRTQ